MACARAKFYFGGAARVHHRHAGSPAGTLRSRTVQRALRPLATKLGLEWSALRAFSHPAAIHPLSPSYANLPALDPGRRIYREWGVVRSCPLRPLSPSYSLLNLVYDVCVTLRLGNHELDRPGCSE